MRQKNLQFNLVTIAVFAIIMLSSSHGYGAQEKAGQCNNKFPNLVTDICWDCMFPVRIGGKAVMSKANMPDNLSAITGNADDYNPDSYSCSCEVDGKTYVGVYVSFWEPHRVMEVIPQPGCFSFLFGMDMTETFNTGYGSKGKSPRPENEKSFQHVHYYAAPLMEMLSIMVNADFCRDKMMSGLDIAYLTEVDPVWNDDELSALLYAEVGLFSNPIAQTLCVVDCLAASLNYPINQLFFCAGCWGGIYPMTGNVLQVGSFVTTSSLQATKLLARLARYPVPPAVEHDTSSSLAKCGGVIRPFLKKSQYRINTLAPIAESIDYHTIGESSLLWGESRVVPGVGEDQTYVFWRKKNCCMRLVDQ